MGSTVLVTGAADLVAAASAAFRDAGVEVIEVDDLTQLAAVVAAITPGSLDCYVQLPVHVSPRGIAVIERVRNFLEDGLLARFSAASTILPVVADEGRILLVGGNMPGEAGNTPGAAATPDSQSARLALLEVLAHAIQADKSATRITVRVLPHDDPAAHIAAVALGLESTREKELAALWANEPEMSFDDWRIEVMGRAHWEF